MEKVEVIEYKGKEYIVRPGGPFDRGACDSYYHRYISPHYYTGSTYNSTRLEQVDMSEEEIAAYYAGYDWNEYYGSKKEFE